MPPPSTSRALHLKLLAETFAVFQLSVGETIHPYILEHLVSSKTGEFLSITRTSEELSIVCDRTVVPRDMDAKITEEWKCIQVVGPMDLSLTGILAALSAPLKEANVPIFVVSTWNTDWLLVTAQNAPAAVHALTLDGWTFEGLISLNETSESS
ncbi:hypothetical protein EXIGLDRAFT_727050 [Exidia glandulosa HHB12029]|uniref:Uncharacterized protein n=1 Tax=Exidia glandulosa HHB12029 TaxID=1314781 RepID=A0A165M3I3_EXIGL|nr:hypothetical protein EXIGLDRAFT_730745 [Exidia glandulosa HHB12029]KZV98714.1 hypothetical protein EXIGLDRAFT_727050 [Exidia glandulosa HHB12029]